jgi:hypothetical protein
LPPIIVHCCHHRHYRCRRATTTSTATTMVKLAINHCQKNEKKAAAPLAYQRQHQREIIYKSRQLDLFNLSTVKTHSTSTPTFDFRDYLAVKKCFFSVRVFVNNG